jgi:cation-transporting ATPase E
MMKSLFRFVFPAAFLLSIAAFLIYILLYFSHDVDLTSLRGGGPAQAIDPSTQIARDALTYLLVLAGLFLVVFAAPPTRWFAVVEETTGDWRPTILAIAMLGLYCVILSIKALRDFFGIHLMLAGDYFVIGVFVILWALALRYIWKKNMFERFFGLAVRT